jgi:glutathione S-transferase
VAGKNVTIADLQYFFEITNLIVYGKDFAKFALVNQWFTRMLEIEEVKTLHEEW